MSKIVNETVKIDLKDTFTLKVPVGHAQLEGLDFESSGHTGFASEKGLNKTNEELGKSNEKISALENAKGQTNGIATLDSNGKVPSSQLPSYVDDVVEYPTMNDFPTVGEKGKIYLATDTGDTYRWSGTIYIPFTSKTTPMVKITYDELKTIRDNGELVPGMQYRITDYMCTTTQLDTRSAGHQFDIIVTADNENTLNENARACIHKGDTPTEIDFQEVNILAIQYVDDFSQLDYQKEKYQNSFLRYENGKIYYDKCSDEHNEDYLEYVGQTSFDGATAGKWKRFDGNEDGSKYADTVFLLLNAWVVDDELIGVKDGTYFKASGANLSAWELKYSLDNDIERFLWADPINGKGVIYYMKDDWNNECPYDFKNIQFKRYQVYDETRNNILNNLNGLYLGISDAPVEHISINYSYYIWAYTFTQYDKESNYAYDASNEIINQSCTYALEELQRAHSNTIKESFVMLTTDDSDKAVRTRSLNNIVFITEEIEDTSYSCRENFIDDDCYDMSFNLYSMGNHIGCYCNTFFAGSKFQNNTFGADCQDNIFGGIIRNNTFGQLFSLNVIGNGLSNSVFEDNCAINTIEGNSNTIKFGVDCQGNTIKRFCMDCIFGSNVSYNIIEIWAFQITFDNHVKFISLTSKDEANSYNRIQGVHIHQGVRGTDDANKIISVERNSPSQINIVAAGTTTIEV